MKTPELASEPCTSCGIRPRYGSDDLCWVCTSEDFYQLLGMRENGFYDEEPPDCPCGAPWQDIKCYAPDGICICQVCGRNSEEA